MKRIMVDFYLMITLQFSGKAKNEASINEINIILKVLQ